MKRYLAIFLCIFFLLGNPVDTALANDEDSQMQEGSQMIQVFRKNAGKTNIKGDKGEIDRENEADKIENLNSAGETDLHFPVNRYSPEDLNLLARLVHAEAKGEPFQGKVAVAATVLNRVREPLYPDTIPEVIYEYNYGFQYCPVSNGEINRPADKEAHQAVREALKGKDPTCGALSFYNPAKSFNGWIRSKPCTAIIGNHIFVK